VTPHTRIREVLGSNLGRDIAYPDKDSSWFSRENAGILPRLGHDHLLTDRYQFIVYLPCYHSTLYSLHADNRKIKPR
jgi:hypothetical protein